VDTNVEIKLVNDNGSVADLPRTADGFFVVGSFNGDGVAEGDLSPFWGPIEAMRLSIQTSSENWVILSEMHIKG